MDYQKALITGASSGIGAGFAKVLPLSTGMLLTGRSAERLDRVKAGLAENDRAACLVADLVTDEGRSAVIERAREEQIDLLICNAGNGWSGDFLQSSIATVRETVNLNVVAVLELTHALLPEMIARAQVSKRRAGIIIVSSMGAFVPAPAGLACYAASKVFGLRLAEALAKEHRADPVDVLALCPTWTATDFFARAGLPPPQRAIPAEAVAKEGLEALGRRTVHLCSMRPYPRLYPQIVRRFAAFNPALAVWRWRLAPPHVAAGSKRRRIHRVQWS